MHILNIRNTIIFLLIIAVSGCTITRKHNIIGGKRNDQIYPNNENVYSIPGEYIITIRKGAHKSIIVSCLSSLEPIIVKKSATENMFLVYFKNVSDIESVKIVASHCNDISMVQPNFRQRSIKKLIKK